MKCPVFFVRKGVWGQYGWRRVPWYLWFIYQFDYVNKIRWIRYKKPILFPKTRERIHDYLLHRRARIRARRYAEQLELKRDEECHY